MEIDGGQEMTEDKKPPSFSPLSPFEGDRTVWLLFVVRSLRLLDIISSGTGRVTERFLYFHAVVPSRTEFYSSVSHAVGGRATSPRSPTPLFHALHGSRSPASVNFNESPSSKHQVQRQEPSSSSPSGSSGVRCNNCDRVIV